MKKVYISIIILLVLIVSSKFAEAKYILTRNFEVNVNTSPFYFEAELDKTKYVQNDNKVEFDITVKNNDGSSYNLYDTNYELSMSNNDKFIFTVNDNDILSKTIDGKKIQNDVLKITLTQKQNVTLDDIENVDIKIRSTYPYEKEIVFTISIIEKTVWNYEFVNNSQTFTVPISGYYKIELWGAQGGGATEYTGGKGAYTCGTIYLEDNTKLYVYVGESGINTEKIVFNNGSSVWKIYDNAVAFPGGGSTDIRINNGEWDDFNSLKSRIMVAGGGGGTQTYYQNISGANAGGLIGYSGSVSGNDGRIATGGTQTSGGNNGLGMHATENEVREYNGFGKVICSKGEMAKGGNGYYAGGNGAHGDGTVGSGAGGSSFISGHNGCDAVDEGSTENNIIHTGQSVHYSGYKFTNTIMIDGSGYKWTTIKEDTLTGMPTYDGINTMIGNDGNGYAKITFIKE